MRKRFFRSLLVTLSACLVATAGAKKVHTLGDSTMANYDENATVTRGWGMYFGNFLTNGWTAVNYARGGRDARGGYNELWQNAKGAVKAGDYVLIQFAHNDEKIGGADREEVYNYYLANGMTAEAATLDTRGTTPSTTYKMWLGKIVDEVKEKGATPVLVGPVCRSYFGSDGKIKRNGRHDLGDSYTKLTDKGLVEKQSVPADNHLMDYPYHMKALAEEKEVAYIDLTTATQALYESYGDAKCHELLFDGDGSTHFCTMGALLVARLCAQLMKEQQILSEDISVPTDLSVNPGVADLGEGYKGQTATKELTLNGFGLNPAEGTISLTATAGIELSVDKKAWSSSLNVDYKNGTLVKTFFARVLMAKAGTFSGTISATLGDKQVDVPLTVNVIELGGGEPFSVNWPFTGDDEATVTGTAIAGGVTMSMLSKYGNNADYGILAYADGGWTAAEDDDPERYVSLSVKCPEGQTLHIDNIAMLVGARGGNGMKCHAYYSTDGFKTRTTIYAPTAMTSDEMNAVAAQPVIQLEEGEELQLRVYPWYTSDATGKYLCVKDVTVSGLSKRAGGVNITGTITYKLDKGGVDQGDDAVMDPTELSAGIIAKKWSAGAALTLNGTKTYTGSNNAKTVQTSIYNDTGSSFASTATPDNTLTLTLTPEDGFNFVPTKVSFEAARYGTDGGTITASIEAGQNSLELCASTPVNRSDKGLDIAAFSFGVSNVVASAANPLKLNFAFIGLGKTKTMGLSNVVIEGQLVGSATNATKHVLTTDITPAGGGVVTQEPDLAAFKEGTAVELTATKNFGYRFKEWQDADGLSLGTDASLSVVMDADKAVTAVFEQVPVFTVSTKVTNDADRPLGGVTLTPNDHDGQYEAGTTIVAEAEESKILRFIQWTDQHDAADAPATRTLTVDSDMELVADYDVLDFVAVFDASVNNYYVYPSTAGYPFSADLTWDDERNAKSSIVKVGDGSLCYTKDGGTPVVRNRTSVVLAGINGLYQNGYRTTDIAWKYEFSTKGFTDITFSADMAAKNMASKQWKALVSVDEGDLTPVDGGTWAVTANTATPISFALPATANDREKVVVLITGDGKETLSEAYKFDEEFDGLDYCIHSESGVGNVYIVGTATDSGETVGISGKKNTGNGRENAALYDLQGRRVNNSQVAKGIYIRKGRKTIF